MMKNKKEEELFQLYLERGLDDIMSFEYFKIMIEETEKDGE